MANPDANTSGTVGLPSGTKIGKYEISQRLAIGGQAVLYKAYDSLLHRDVAIKQVSSHLVEDPKFLERFREEARILARLGAEQPSIVTVHELIENSLGLFIVMDYIPGESLEKILTATDGPIEAKAVLQVLWRLAAALNVVHAEGIIHRDIKPGNILISEGLWPTIIDFGVAASLSGQTSMLLGTTKYMAPELFDGSNVDGRADMYSLGIVAYEMLLGRNQFNEVFADVVRDARSATVRWMKWHGDRSKNAPPLHEVNEAIPVALSQIVARMTAKDPDDRYENMEALGRAIKEGFSRRRTGESAGGVAVGASAAQIQQTQAQSSAGGADAAGELDESLFEAEPTARLPKSTMSLRTKLILVGAAAAVIVTVGLVLGFKAWQGQRDYRQSVLQAYGAAEKDYEDGRYDQALDGFRALPTNKDYSRPVEFAKASVFAALCRGYLAVRDGDWKAAADAEKKAKEQRDKIQRQWGSKLSDQWVTKAGHDIDVFRQHKANIRSFAEAMDKADAAVGEKQFDLARLTLEKMSRDISSSELYPSQRKRIEVLKKKIDLSEFMAGYRALVDSGDRLTVDGKLDQAGKRFSDAMKKLKSVTGRSLVSERAYQQLLADLNTRREKVAELQRYNSAVAAAAEARKKKDKQGEIAALKNLIAIRPSAAGDYSGRIKQLETEIALAAVDDLIKRGGDTQAISALEAILAKNPNNATAKTKLAGLLKRRQWDKLVREGNAAFDGRNWLEAYNKFQSARRLDRARSASLAEKITECSFQIKLGQADKLRDAAQYDKALEAYERARRIKKSADDMVQARIEAMIQTRDMEKYMANATKALKGKEFGVSLRWLEKARQLRPDSRKIASLIADTRYSQQMAFGKSAMERQEYNVAKGYFTVALGIKKTKEVQNLIEEAKRKIEKNE